MNRFLHICFKEDIMSVSHPQFIDNSDTKPKSFFTRKSGSKIKRLKPIVYKVYLCCKCLGDDSDDIPESKENIDNTKIIGAWAADIIRPPQDASKNIKRNVYTLVGTEEADDPIQIQLKAVREVLIWITGDVNSSQWSCIEATIITNDVFLMNLLKEWIPKWHTQNYMTRKHEKRPNAALLQEIGDMSTQIKLTMDWQVDISQEMLSVREHVVGALHAPLPPSP